MHFKSDGELFNTQTMLALDLDGHYLRLFLDMERHLAFVQQFTLDEGITVSPVSSAAALELIHASKTSPLPDDLAFIDALTGSATRQLVADPPSALAQ